MKGSRAATVRKWVEREIYFSERLQEYRQGTEANHFQLALLHPQSNEIRGDPSLDLAVITFRSNDS